MKEFNYIFSEGIKKGLSQYSNNPLNDQALSSLLNMKVAEKGIKPYTDIKNIPNDVSISWPYPQIFKGSYYCFLADETTVYNIGISNIAENINITSSSSLTDELDSELLDELADALTWSGFQSLGNLPIGDFWDFADFGKYIILTNGSVIIFIDYETNPDDPAISSMEYSSIFPRCKTYCNFKGQIIGGNVQTSWHDCSSTSVIWSKIGYADFTPMVGMESGFKILGDASGDIHKVLRLGDGIAVYGDNSVVLMKPEEVKFGFFTALEVGIPSIKAIAGSDSEHVFVDNLYRIWRWKDGKKPELLDYSHHIENLTLDNIIVSVDKSQNEYYISDGLKTYLLTDYGLSEIHQLITSVFHHEGNVYGVVESVGASGFYLESERLDFGLRGLKTIVAIEVGISYSSDYILDELTDELEDEDSDYLSASDIHGSVSWKSNIAGSFSNTTNRLINPNGVFYPKVTGDEFKIKLVCPTRTNLQIDYMNIRINTTDKRSIRGRIDVS